MLIICALRFAQSALKNLLFTTLFVVKYKLTPLKCIHRCVDDCCLLFWDKMHSSLCFLCAIIHSHHVAETLLALIVDCPCLFVAWLQQQTLAIYSIGTSVRFTIMYFYTVMLKIKNPAQISVLMHVKELPGEILAWYWCFYCGLRFDLCLVLFRVWWLPVLPG